MEGKTVILSFLIVSLVIAQNQVEAGKGVCCPSTAAISKYHICVVTKHLQSCMKDSGCIYVTGQPTCPPGYPYATLVNSVDTVNEYCKLGCTSSVCGALTTLQDYDANEIVNGAVAQCTNACANFCTKGSAMAVEAA